MALLTKELILACTDLKTETVDVPEWGGEVLLQGLNGEQREVVEIRIDKATKKDAEAWKGVKALTLSFGIINPDKTPMFAGEKDVAALAKKSSAAIDRLFERLLTLSGMTKKDREEIAKN